MDKMWVVDVRSDWLFFLLHLEETHTFIFWTKPCENSHSAHIAAAHTASTQ